MKKNKHLFKSLAVTAFLLAVSSNGLLAQKEGTVNPNRCGSPVPDAQWEAWMQEKVNELNQQRIIQGNNTAVVNYTIPVIFHVIHNQNSVTAENISAAQITSQITILNADYSGTNTDVSNIPSTFQSVKAGNTGIQFCLAKTDPSGNLLAEAGIERIKWSTRGWTDPNTLSQANTQTYFDGTIKPATIWDPTKYLNIWVAKLDGSGLLGYASFPAGTGLTGLTGVETATTCGVVLNQSAVGNTGTAAAPYNKGRTATHEIGHWLGLRHIWGDGTCATDYCNDTPSAETANYNCQTHPYNTAAAGGCAGNTTGEMFMNYMDYVPDACMYMFTLDQTTRMQTSMANGTYRAPLATSTKCNNPVALDIGITNIMSPLAGQTSCNTSVTPVVVITNGGTTTLTSGVITYKMDAGANQVYNWSGSLTSGSSATVTLNAFTGLSAATHTFTATVSAPNGGADGFAGNNTQTATFTVTAATGTALPFTEGFQGTTFVPAGWNYTAPNAPYSWSRIATTGGFGTSTACAKMDNYTSSSSIVGQKDAMRTPLLTFAGANSTLNLKFDVAYAPYNATLFDSLNVWISTDCGTSWTKIYNKGNTTLATATTTTVSFVPTAAQWRTETVNLSSYAGQTNVYLKFESVSGWGNNLYLDNINISYTASSAPVANFTTSATKCAGQPITFTDASTNTPTSWNWSATPSTGVTISSATAQNPTITFATAGTYTVSHTATNAGGTSPSYTQAVVVNATPSMTSATTKSICSGTAVGLALTSSVASSYSWIAATNANVTGESTTAQAGATITNTLSVSGTSAQTVTYSVTPTATTGGCVGAVQTVSVTVNPLPSMTSANTASVCSGNPVGLALTSNVASSYSWIAASNANVTGESTTAQSGATITNTLSVSGTASQTVSYSVTPTSTAGSCAGSVQTVTVTVNPAPAMTNATTATICSGNAVGLALTSNVASSYSWIAANNTNVTGESTTAQAGATITNTLSVSGTTAQTVTYSVTPTSTTGSCAGTAQIVTVTVNPAPAMTSANTASVCSGSSVGLALTSNIAATYSWIALSNANVTGESTTAQTGATITNTLSITGTTPRTVTYSVTPTATSGSCPGAVQTVSVTVNPVPTLTAMSNITNACAGSVVTVPNYTVSTGTVSWTNSNTAIGLAASGSGNIGSFTASSVAATTTGTITATASLNGCTSAPRTFNIAVNPQPIIAVNANPASANVCQGGNITLSATGATSYVWTGGVSNGVSFSPAATATYTVTGTGANGCTNTTTQLVTVNPLPVVTVNSPSTCSGVPVLLNAGGASGYSWSDGSTGASISVSPVTNTSYTVTGTDANGCQNVAVSNVTISAAPTVNANSAVICNGQSVTLTATGANAYSWTTGDNTASATVNPTVTTTYTVTGTNGPGCTNTYVATVTVNSLPNVGISSSATGAVCGGTSVNLTAGGADTYIWSDNSTSVVNTVSPSVTTTYSVTGTDVNGCTATASVTVNVFSTTAPTVTANGTILTSSPAVSYQWYLDGNALPGETNQSITVTQNGNYTVETVDANGCTTISAGFPVAGIGIKNTQASVFVSVYPNPNEGTFSVKASLDASENYTLMLTNVLGQVVYSEQLKDISVVNRSFNQQEAGVYFIIIRNGNGASSVSRIVVE